MVSATAPAHEPTAYDKSARYYDSGRLVYSPILIRHAVTIARIGPDSTVLDLGCGPGTIANDIAAYTGRVIGVDPSEAMPDVARETAPGNVTYVQGTSSDLSFVDRPVTLATFGRSFHWMNREATLDRLMLPGGCLAFFNVNPIPKAGKAHAWWHASNKAMEALSALDKDEEEPFGAVWEINKFPLMRSAFSLVTDRGILGWHDWSCKKILHWHLSRYKSGRDQLEERLPEVEATLKKTLARYGPGPWKTLNQHKVMIARRPG